MQTKNLTNIGENVGGSRRKQADADEKFDEHNSVKGMKRFAVIAIVLAWWATATAQPDLRPLYIVNGAEWSAERVKAIPEKNIEHIETFPADEQTVARYGERANNGVIVISLRYDRPARFTGGESFADYVSKRIHWPSHYPTARFVVRYTIGADGVLTLGDELESTDRTLRKRALKVIRSAPRWEPATKAGVPVESESVVAVQLPEGRELPREPYVILL